MAIGGIISAIKKGSLAEELDLKVGDKIISINNQKLADIIDLSFAMSDEEIEMLVEHENGQKEILCFEKELDEELGAEFQSAMFGKIRQCCNNCYFCFVDQVAPNMRDSLYIKDDDYRLSFLYGNFVTLTNIGPVDLDRIKNLHLSPLYVSVHTTNPILREKMLRTKRAALIMDQLKALQKTDIDFHAQIVLCPNLNDGVELDKTIEDLINLMPHAKTLGIVPVGLTKFRDGCYPLEMFNKDSARAVISQVEKYQKIMREKTGKNFVYLSDEFYILAQMPLPKAEFYDGFPQLDNGIGLSRNFIEEFDKTNAINKKYHEYLDIDIVCGTSAGIILKDLLKDLNIENLNPEVLPITNEFFGKEITVSGLLTGVDIIKNLKESKKNRNRRGIVLPASCLRDGDDIFLDDLSLTDLKNEFANEEIKIAKDGKELKEILTNWYDYKQNRQRAVYTWQSNAGYTKSVN